jgi:hypothetical protein
MANTLSIGTFNVRQLDGLFSLNDLHKAAGGEPKHQPSFFIRNEQTQALLSELSSANLQTMKTVTGKGKQQGTYACRELVIAYASWINAAFQLKVIRVFLDSAAPQVQPAPALDYDRISPAQAQTLKEFVGAVVTLTQQPYPQVWARLHNKFRVNSYLQLPASRFNEACQYLQGKRPDPDAMHALPAPVAPVTPAAQPQPAPMQVSPVLVLHGKPIFDATSDQRRWFMRFKDLEFIVDLKDQPASTMRINSEFYVNLLLGLANSMQGNKPIAVGLG